MSSVLHYFLYLLFRLFLTQCSLIFFFFIFLQDSVIIFWWHHQERTHSLCVEKGRRLLARNNCHTTGIR